LGKTGNLIQFSLEKQVFYIFMSPLQYLNCAAQSPRLFINIHSHNAPSANEWMIQNLHNHWEKAALPGHFSIGIHPRYIEGDGQEQVRKLKQWSTHPHVLAIGECGLDKVCSTDFSLQQEVFAQQILLANAIQKTLIIHCVRAWEEVFSLLKKKEDKIPVIFHGFAKNAAMARRITSNGYYISFGKALQQEGVREALRHIPPERFFLETDDAALSIETVYDLAARSLSIDHNSLSLQLQQNATAVFGAAIFQS